MVEDILLHDFKELDYMKTKRNVLKAIKKYEKSLMRLSSNCHPKITTTYTLDMPNYGSGFHSSTEDSAIYSIEGYKVDEEYVKKIVDCLNRLTLIYREIMWYSFFENLSNDEVADKLGISISLLTIRKRTAIELFAYGLGLEVYE